MIKRQVYTTMTASDFEKLVDEYFGRILNFAVLVEYDGEPTEFGDDPAWAWTIESALTTPKINWEDGDKFHMIEDILINLADLWALDFGNVQIHIPTNEEK